MAGPRTLSVAVQADLHNTEYLIQWGTDHTWFPLDVALIKIIGQIPNCLGNLLGVSGYAAEMFSQTILPAICSEVQHCFRACWKCARFLLSLTCAGA